MTLTEAFIFKAGNDVDTATAGGVLQFAGLNPADSWNPNDAGLKCAFYGALIGYLAKDKVGLKQVTEGGYTEVYDIGAKASYLEALANESGCQDLIDKYRSVPVVQNRSYLW